MSNPFDFLLSRINLKKTRKITWLSQASQHVKDLYDSARTAPPVMPRQSEDLPHATDISQNSYSDRIHPLNFNIIQLAELLLNTDLGKTRIHTGPEAENLARRAGADAVTAGNDIYFREGNYNPETEEGKNLLIHELHHVAQYNNDRTPRYQEDRDALEYEAYSTEGNMAGRELHHLGQNHTPLSPFKSSELEDFSREEPKLIRITTKSGRDYLLTEEELEQVKRNVKEWFSQFVHDNWMIWDFEKKERVMRYIFEK